LSSPISILHHGWKRRAAAGHPLSLRHHFYILFTPTPSQCSCHPVLNQEPCFCQATHP
jgi:hypothetical protein